MAASIQNAAERERRARIQAFIDDANAPVPPPVRGLESMPGWFDLWSWINVVAFVGLMGRLVLLLLPRAGGGNGLAFKKWEIQELAGPRALVVGKTSSLKELSS